MPEEEKSIEDQIQALVSWALEAKNELKEGNISGVEENLRNIAQQSRRMEWRGGKWGLKHLPDIKEVKTLKKEITQARAADIAARNLIKKKDLAGAAEQVDVLQSFLLRARSIASEKPWINLDVLLKNGYITYFLKKEGYYAHVDTISLWNTWNDHFKKIPLGSINLSNADLRGYDFSGEVSFSYTNLEGANLEKASFGKWLQGTNFKKANLKGAILGSLNAESVKFNEADLQGAFFQRSKLNYANFSKAKLLGVDFSHCTGAEKAIFTEADASEAKLEYANFIRADLSGANFTGANFLGSILSGANLTETNFTRAYLKYVDFKGAVLKGADLLGANLDKVKNLTLSQLLSAKNWSKAGSIPEELMAGVQKVKRIVQEKLRKSS